MINVFMRRYFTVLALIVIATGLGIEFLSLKYDFTVLGSTNSFVDPIQDAMWSLGFALVLAVVHLVFQRLMKK